MKLWQSDGTAAGTTLLDDINPGSGSSFPSFLAVSGGNLYFVADDGTNGRELWKSDGTTAGTLVTIFPTNSYAQRLTDVNGTLYFESQFISGRPTARSPAPPSSVPSSTRDT